MLERDRALWARYWSHLESGSELEQKGDLVLTILTLLLALPTFLLVVGYGIQVIAYAKMGSHLGGTLVGGFFAFTGAFLTMAGMLGFYAAIRSLAVLNRRFMWSRGLAYRLWDIHDRRRIRRLERKTGVTRMRHRHS
ncbi:MAG: hypothetical protein KGJ93_04680 [Patescibacteria group bacterium]|nr:hypothetical protein [Patescibacteria group bacterium]